VRTPVLTLITGLCLAGAASAGEVLVSSDITTSTTWTADNTYNLTTQIYVTNGATLTIDPGVVVASTPTMNGSGSLAVTRGSQIFVNGTASQPVIMTSTADDFANWRAAANEWGNLTIMGNAFISENAIVTNSATCSPTNMADMEGLVNGPTTDRYGGGNDDDDSGEIHYLSLRYGGRVVGLTNELNGMSLGGVGRGTDIDHVEVMNNVDDGIEIFGGTVNLKYFSLWNVGDDSLDIDQGWRGKAQFGLIVQGYSVDANQGSGVGDNAIETDGAEDSDYQPVSTAAVYNLTVIGNPIDGDGLTAWRDGARIQYHNCIFMDGGEAVVRFDNVDGDGAHGYGFNGTLTWGQVWTTDYDFNFAVPQHANDCPNPTTVYQSQVGGKLASITDSVFFRNLSPIAYTEANARGVFDAANDNVLIPGYDNCDMPIRSLTRAEPFFSTIEGKGVPRVIKIDPRAYNEAETSVGTAPNDGFFTQAQYRGAFSPTENWLLDWTAADQYGFIDRYGSSSFCNGTDLSLLSCPCSNPGNYDSGCDSPIPAMQGGGLTGGVKLDIVRQETTPTNRATVTGSGYPTGSTPGAVVIRAAALDSAAPVVFGDGLRCIGVPLVRLGATAAAGGVSTHTFGHGAMAGSGCFYYQIWYRVQPVTYCDALAAYSLSNGQTLDW
jgi:hypothetical protein